MLDFYTYSHRVKCQADLPHYLDDDDDDDDDDDNDDDDNYYLDYYYYLAELRA